MSSAQAEFVELVEARAKEKSVSFGEAMTEIARERPKLYDEYREEVIKRDTVTLTPPSEPPRTMSDPRIEFVAAIKAEMRERGVMFGEAMISVARARPKLTRDYREKVLAGK